MPRNVRRYRSAPSVKPPELTPSTDFPLPEDLPPPETRWTVTRTHNISTGQTEWRTAYTQEPPRPRAPAPAPVPEPAVRQTFSTFAPIDEIGLFPPNNGEEYHRELNRQTNEEGWFAEGIGLDHLERLRREMLFHLEREFPRMVQNNIFGPSPLPNLEQTARENVTNFADIGEALSVQYQIRGEAARTIIIDSMSQPEEEHVESV